MSTLHQDAESIQNLNQQKRFVEALYFGALALARTPSAALHLQLGLACCGAIRPVAMLNRTMYEPGAEEDESLDRGGLVVSSGTLLVYDGYFHFIEALRGDPQIHLASELEPVAAEVFEQLGWYLRQEFHGLGGGLAYDLRSAAQGATLLLHRLGRVSAPLPAAVERRRSELEQAIARHITAGH